MIQTAIGYAQDDDEVLVYPGIYFERLRVQGKSVAIRGSAGFTSTIVDARATSDEIAPVVIVDGGVRTTNVALEGITLQGGRGGGSPGDELGGGVDSRMAHLLVTRCRLTANVGDRGAAAVVHDGGVSFRENVVAENVVEDDVRGAVVWIEASGVVAGNEIGPNQGGAVHVALLGLDGGASVDVVDNVMFGNVGGSSAGGVAITGFNHVRVAGNTIIHNQGVTGGIRAEVDAPGLVAVEGNTIAWNSSSIGGTSGIMAFGSATVVRNIVTGDGTLVALGDGVEAEYSCNDAYCRERACRTYAGSDLNGINGNFGLDPQFCGVESDNVKIASSSPCAPGNDPYGANCGLIGAGEVGCDPTTVLRRSWGEIKRRYR